MTIDGSNVCFGGLGGLGCFDWPSALIYLGSVALVLALTLGMLVWDARRTPTPSQVASRANRHATLASVVGVALLVVVLTRLGLTFVIGIRNNGRVLATLPALAGACLLAAQALGQLTWPKPSGAHREAELVARTIADVAPAWPRRMVFVWSGTALVLLLVFALVADGPRSVTREAGRYTQAIGPYPGWYYGLPMGLAILALVAGTELVLRLVTLRAAVAGVSTEWDLHLRRRSAGHITRGIQLVLACTVAGILISAGWVHLSLGSDFVQLAAGGYASGASPVQHYLGQGLLIAALGILLAGLAVTVVPLRRGQRKDAAGLVAVAS